MQPLFQLAYSFPQRRRIRRPGCVQRPEIASRALGSSSSSAGLIGGGFLPLSAALIRSLFGHTLSVTWERQLPIPREGRQWEYELVLARFGSLAVGKPRSAVRTGPLSNQGVQRGNCEAIALMRVLSARSAGSRCYLPVPP
jgi:hypothetical protein